MLRSNTTVQRNIYIMSLNAVAVKVALNFFMTSVTVRRSKWPRGLRHRSSAARLLRSWVRIPPGAWLFVYCECCVLSDRGLCDGLITRPEEPYRL